jgi:hypothetical protein
LVWLDEQIVESFPEFENGRRSKWRKLLREFVVPVKYAVKNEPDLTVAAIAAAGDLTNGGVSHVEGPV